MWWLFVVWGLVSKGGQWVLCATVTCVGRAILLVREPSGQMTLATVTLLEPSSSCHVIQHPHRLTLFVKSRCWGQPPISSIGMLDHHQSSMAAIQKNSWCAWTRHTSEKMLIHYFVDLSSKHEELVFLWEGHKHLWSNGKYWRRYYM